MKKNSLSVNVVGFCLFFILTNSVYCSADQKTNNDSSLIATGLATIIWVQQQNKAFELFHSSLRNGKWSKSKQLTFSKSVNYVPTIDSDKKGTVWVVWSANTIKGIQLHYATMRNGIVVKQPTPIETGMNSNVGPHIVIDNEGKPRLVWSGFSGINDDIFYSEFTDGSWQKPQRVHRKNSISDFLPQIFVDQMGIVSVEWSTIEPDGQFILEKKLLSKDIVRTPVNERKSQVRKTNKNLIEQCLFTLPAGLDNPQLSSGLISCDGGKTHKQIQYLGSYLQTSGTH